MSFTTFWFLIACIDGIKFNLLNKALGGVKISFERPTNAPHLSLLECFQQMLNYATHVISYFRYWISKDARPSAQWGKELHSVYLPQYC